MFLVNSRLGLLSAAPSRSTGMPLHATGAPLLPKLRGQFAEFLDGGSLVHLGMLYQPTCVGLRYGRAPPWLEAFLGSTGSIRAAWGCTPRLPITSQVIVPTDLPTGTPYRLGGLAAPDLPPCVPPSLITVGGGTGILTRCPSPTPRGLGLGPPHPQLISMAAEPWGIRWGGFAPPSRYSCRHSHSRPLQVALPLRLLR